MGYGLASSNALADLIEAIKTDTTLGESSNSLEMQESSNTVELEGVSCVKRTLILSISYETEKFGNQ